jgi:16S rRNA pseudouridine516 synthase
VPRLDELVARNLGTSRAEARALVTSGTLTGDAGAPLGDPRATVTTLPLPVTFEGQRLALHDAVHVALHKPLGCVTALRDDHHPVAYALLRDAPLFAELRPVGRLDVDTNGLLLWTTEGTWLQRLTHPKRAVPRTYHAALARPFRAPPPGFTLEDGHRPALADLRTLAPGDAHPALARPADATVYAAITLTGGAYHEVRRIFAALGSHVLGLCRVSYGKLRLPEELAPGAFRLIARDDV